MRRYRTLILVIAILALGFYFLWPTLLRYLLLEGLRSAQRSGSRITWTGLEVQGLKLQFNSLSAWLPGPPIKGSFRAPIRIDLGRSEFRLVPSSLILLNPTVEFTVNAYNGVIDGQASHLTSKPLITATLKDVDLGQHPQLRALGLASASVSGTITDLQELSPNVPSGTLDVKISQIDIPEVTQAVPLVKLEPLTGGEIRARAELRSDSLTIHEISLESPYATVTGSCKALDLSGSRPPTASGNFTVSLHRNFQQQIGPFLPMLSANILSPTTERFSANMSGAACSSRGPDIGEIAVGALCLRFVPRPL